jgi:hypothetical protein
MRSALALALADLRERVRRPGYLVVLLGAVALGYAAVPPASATYAMLRVGPFRGTYDSAYVGTAVALVGGLWLSLAGFYVVKNGIARDESTRVGQILAATPLRRATYLIGKSLSNLVVLASMGGVLAVTALIMVMARGESDGIDLAALWLPFVLFCLPVLAVGAAGAVVFETIPLLRSAIGNVIWFFGWMVGIGFASGGIGAFDPLGFVAITRSMSPDVQHQHPNASDTELSAGLVIEDRPPERFDWSGLDIGTGLIGERVALLAVAAGLVLVSASWFHRFDTEGRRTPTRTDPMASAGSSVGQAFARTGVPRTKVSSGSAFHTLLLGEIRILFRAAPWWSWLLVAGVTTLAILLPAGFAAYPLLPVAWLLPVLLWSRLGTQRYEHEVHTLVDCAPARHHRLVAEWMAGFALTGVAGFGPLLRFGFAGDWTAVGSWIAAAAFIPTFALTAGLLGRNQRLFQAAYLALWYAAFNRMEQADFMGVVGTDNTSGALVVALTTASLAGTTLLLQQARHATR